MTFGHRERTTVMISIEQMQQCRSKWIRRERLVVPSELPPEHVKLLSARIPALSDPAHFTKEALLLSSILNPPMVRRAGDYFEVIGGLRIAQCLSYLPGSQIIMVVLLPGNSGLASDQLVVQATLLQCLTHGQDTAQYKNSVLALWEQLSPEERASLSQRLTTKIGLSDLTGINRRASLPEPTFIPRPLTLSSLEEGGDD